MREVVNGLMYILSTGCQWRAIPKDLPPRSSVYDYFDLWTYDGTLNESTTRSMNMSRTRAEGSQSDRRHHRQPNVKSAEKGGVD